MLSVQNQAAHAERRWYEAAVVAPELVRVGETLAAVGVLLRQKVKLPVSSAGSEAVKGVMVREGAVITAMQLALRDRHFHHTRLHSVRPVAVPQVAQAAAAVAEAVEMVNGVNASAADAADTTQASATIGLLERVRSAVHRARTLLQLPLDPALVFPTHVADPLAFEPPLVHTAVDVYISQAEVCIDLKKLHVVTESPWGDVRNGRSYVDDIRDDMKRSGTATPDDRPPTVGDLDSMHPSTFLDSVWSRLSLKHQYAPADYITKCVTYDESVVMVSRKLEVSSPDPVLLSAFTKLDSLDYLISGYLENLAILG